MKTKVVRENGREEKGSEKRHSEVVSFRLNRELADLLREKAEEEGLSLSEFAREVLSERSVTTGHGKLWKGEEGSEDDAMADGEEARQEEIEEEAREEAQARLEAFLETVQKSARSLAQGWVRCKLLPKIEMKRKREAKEAAALAQVHEMREEEEEKED